MNLNEKIYWGPTDIANYVGISKGKAFQFIHVIREEYGLDEKRLLKGKVPRVIALDFFDFEKYKKSPDM